MSLNSEIVADFAKTISGEVFYPGTSEYNAITKDRWNLFTLQYQPALIVRPKTVSDVQATVLFGKKVKKQVVPRNGGHSFKSQQNDIIVVDMRNFKQVSLNKDTGIVVAGAGLTLGELDDATAPWHVPIGVVTSTGVLGLGLHGGVGLQERQHGYTVDNVISAQVVTADGQFVTASEKENSDLFWAIRGAASSFGIVTEVTLQSYHIDNVFHGVVGFPFTRESLDMLLEFGDSIFSNQKVTFYVVCGNAPDGSMKLALALMLYYGPKEEAEKVFAPILDKKPVPVMSPEMKSFNTVQKALAPLFGAGYWYLTGDSVPGKTLSSELRASIIEEWNIFPANYLGGLVIEMRGGKSLGVAVSSTAAPFDRSHAYDLVICCGSADPNEAENVTKHVRRARDNFGLKSKTQGGLPAFSTSTDLHYSVQQAYGPNAERLIAIKQKYDPENFFQGMTNILPSKKFC